MNPSSEMKMALFKVDNNFVKDSGITMEEAIVEADSNCFVTLVLQNSASYPVYLKEGQLLGVVQEMSEEVAEETHVKALQAVGSNSESVQDTDCLKLKDLLTEYQHVFALDNSELGSTDLVEHLIDTGDSKPIHQHPRRIPFALREKVDEMVQEMLEQGVIQHSQSPWTSPKM